MIPTCLGWILLPQIVLGALVSDSYYVEGG